jgi:hypothetical protein
MEKNLVNLLSNINEFLDKVVYEDQAFPRNFSRHSFRENGVECDPVPRSKIFAIFMFATPKSTVLKSLHKQKRYKINVTF